MILVLYYSDGSSICSACQRSLFLVLFEENLLQNSVEDSWTDSNLNRVSVIQFQEEIKAEEDDDDEAAAERRVSRFRVRPLVENKWTDQTNDFLTVSQGLQRRATPHPSELKVMKKVIEERRNEAFTSRADGEESTDAQVNSTCSTFGSTFQGSFYTVTCFLFICVQEKRLSDLSNQSHDSQVSNSTLSANSVEDRHLAPSQREDLADGNSVQEEELDEMEVEYIEVRNFISLLLSL